jgi:hypothetical protein
MDNPYANEFRPNQAPQAPPHKPFVPYAMNDSQYAQDNAFPPAIPVNQYVPNNPRQPIKLDSSPSDAALNAADSMSPTSAKKQSWIKRRFSKRDN